MSDRRRPTRVLQFQNRLPRNIVLRLVAGLDDGPEAMSGVMLLPDIRRRHACCTEINIWCEKRQSKSMLISYHHTFALQTLEPDADNIDEITSIAAHSTVLLQNSSRA